MKKNIKYILVIFIFSCFLSSLVFMEPFHRGHDTTFHVANIVALGELIENGKGDSLIVPHIASNLGYGTRIFYSPLSHIVTAVISVIFSSFDEPVTIAFRLVHFFTFFLSGLSMYFLAEKVLKQKRLALFSSLFYFSMPYFISDIYIRCALAESLLFIFLPLILLGLINLLDGDLEKFYPLFIIGYIGGMLSHLTMMVYATFFFGIFLLCYSKKFFKKETFIPFLKASFVVFLSTLFFLVPLIIHKVFGDYAVFQSGYMARDIGYAALKIFDFNPFRNLDDGTVQYYFSVVVIILLVFTYLFRKKIKFPKYTKGLFIFGLISFIMSTVIFPWDYLPYSFQIIQFPWRLQTFYIIVVSLFAPLALTAIKDSKMVDTLIIIGLIIGSNISIHFAWDVLIDYDNIDWEHGMGWGYEYLPSAAIKNLDYFNNRNSDEIIVIKDSNALVNVINSDIVNFRFEVSELESDEVVLELPRIFYFGYELTDEDGEEVKIYENENGFIETKLKKTGVYELEYVGFPISKIISIISIFSFSGIYIFNYLKKDKKSNYCLTNVKQKL